MEDYFYHVVICEEGSRLGRAKFKYLNDARRFALLLVDDALPRNTIEVVHLVGDRPLKVGHAFVGHEGQAEWEPTKDA